MNLSFRIQKNIDYIFDYLTNMQKYVSVHPVIYQIDNIENGSCLVHEKLTVGFIPFSFTYPVTIEKNMPEKKVVFKATVFKLIAIEMKFDLTADNGFTIINEEITFKSPFPVTFIMQAVFKKQHHQLFKNIEQQQHTHKSK